jgi:hypothetical protein
MDDGYTRVGDVAHFPQGSLRMAVSGQDPCRECWR